MLIEKGKYMTNIIIIGVLAVVLGAAAGYVYKSKKAGHKCIGCPSGGNCNSCGSSCGCNYEVE